MSPLRILAVGAFAATAQTASAFDWHSDPKVYPKCERKYINSFPKPSINPGTCFGYYPTQWRSWAEACGQPDVIYSSGPPAGEAKPIDPKAKPPEIAPIPKVDATPAPKVDPKPLPIPVPEVKPVEPKKSGDGRSAMLPVPAETVSISTPAPAAVVAPPIPLIPTMPQVNLK